MSSSSAIGSASVVLSANADGLVAGLNKAEKKVDHFGGSVGKKLDKAGGGGGGIFGAAFGGAALGGAVGALAGTVASGLMKGFEVLKDIPDLIRGLADKATGPEAGPLRGIVKSMDKALLLAEKVGGKFFAAVGPGIVAISDVAEGLAQRFDSLIGKVGAGVGAAFTVGVEIAGELITLVGEVVEWFFKWSTELIGVADTSEGAGKVVMSIFRGITIAAAYAWDTLKAGAGAIAWVAGKIVTGLGHVIESFQAVGDLARSLPDSLRPAWAESFADAMGSAGRRVRDVGAGMSEWGASAVTGFGSSAAAVDEWMDGVEQRFESRRASLEKVAALDSVKLGGALDKGGAAAYSVVTKFNTNAMVSESDPAKIAAQKQEETNRLLRDILRGISGAAVLQTI